MATQCGLHREFPNIVCVQRVADVVLRRTICAAKIARVLRAQRAAKVKLDRPPFETSSNACR